MSAVGTVDVVVPDAIDDPLRPSGGNRYDRRLCDLLPESGWQVREHRVHAGWPAPGAAGEAALERIVRSLADGALVLVDGLLAGAPALVTLASRARLVVLVHAVPTPDAGAALDAARAVIATSGWLRGELLRAHRLPARAVHVAEPGVDSGPPATGTAGGGALLCVGSVAGHKGHDVLLGALAGLASLNWRCRCVGGLDHDASFAAAMRRAARRDRIDDRVRFTGPLAGARLDAAYGASDVLVHPARTEGFGMVVTEALAHALPVITTTAGGLPGALGTTVDGERPGLLVPPGDVAALRGALAAWLTDVDLRGRLRTAARARRGELRSWRGTAQRVAAVLRSVP